ncbi:hypothetical protein CIL03_15610 [Virgibacillus indicus]|uniref:Uncharacterized protein n=1 Tax=Virgibacillus indicus TaxID=2024554 RepID=A0A265N683_9BACI|nr:DUF4362 domain-containing protein [Virgibacillus indicus]OZU87520.1 hypothetical protein CIL03_15610 [Virgibacillus indicus]
MKFLKTMLYLSSLVLLTSLLYGCNTSGTDSPKNTYSGQEQAKDRSGDSEGEKIQEETYIPNEEDVIFKNNKMRNKERLDEFVKTAGDNNESQIRVVKYEEHGAIIYDLKSRYDENAGVGWVRVSPDLSYYHTAEDEVQDVFNNAPQQCANISKDTAEGYYKLHECRTNWEYRLLPIVSGTLSKEDLENSNQENEESEVIEGHYYYLDDITTEIFLSKKDAEEWQQYYEENDQENIEEATLNNIAKGLENRVDLDRIISNEVLVTSCEAGVCEIYTEHSFEFKAFAVPEVKIKKDTGTGESEEQPQKNAKTDKDSFLREVNTLTGGILDYSSELINLYASGVSGPEYSHSAKSLYDKVNGRVNILRHTLVPEDERTENQYSQLLMTAEFLFNSLHQGQLYLENGREKELEILVEEEVIPLREELEELAASVKGP